MVRFMDDRLGGDRNDRERAVFSDLIANLCLTEIPLTDRRFTWTNMRDNRKSHQTKQGFGL